MLDYFVVSPTVEKLLVSCKVLERTEIKTHDPVALSLRCGGLVPNLTKWIRPAAPAAVARVAGPRLAAPLGPELEALLAEQCWQQPVVGQELTQEAADEIWELWCVAARKEIAALTEAEPAGIGEACVFQPFCPLAKARAVAGAARWKLGGCTG